MIDVVEAGAADRADWDAYVSSEPGAEPYHPYAWRDVMERTYGNRCYYLLARRGDGRVAGVLPLVRLKSLLFGTFLVSIPGFSYCGVLASDAQARDALVEAARALAVRIGASHVELRHRAGSDLGLPCRDEKVRMRLDLPESGEQLWSGFTSKLRAQVRRPQKEGATCDDGGLELLDDFYAVFARNMRDLGTPVFPRALFREICTAFPDSTRLFVVRLDGTPCAAGITYGFGHRLEIPSASSIRDFNRQSVNMLLYWSALTYAIREGYKEFDFGRSTVDSGTYRFKKQWGATPEPLHWHYILLGEQELPRLNPDNPKFRLATRVWQHLPLPLANVLGPRIVRNLP